MPHRPGPCPPSTFTGWSSTATLRVNRFEPLVTGPFVTGPFVTGPFVTGPFVAGRFVAGPIESPSLDAPTGGHKLTVGLVTDSASSLPVDLADASGVTVVPMWVVIGGQQFRDGELSLAEVLERVGEGLSTSGPAPGELAQAAAAADRGDGVVILTLSQNMSGVYQSARLAMDLLEGKKVAVVDTGTAAGAEGLVVLAAARAAREGLALDSVVEAARRGR